MSADNKVLVFSEYDQTDISEIKWVVRDSANVSKGHNIGTIYLKNKTAPVTVKAPASGSFYIRQTKYIQKGDIIAEIIICTHEVVFSKMCVNCGQDVQDIEEKEESKAYASIAHHKIGVSDRQAQILEAEYLSRLTKEKKLILVLDLDHTLIHTVYAGDIGERPDTQDTEDIYEFKLMNDKKMYKTKLRPGLRHFLKY